MIHYEACGPLLTGVAWWKARMNGIKYAECFHGDEKKVRRQASAALKKFLKENPSAVPY